MKEMSQMLHEIAYVFTYFSWSSFFAGAGYFAYIQFHRQDNDMRRLFAAA